MSALTLLTAFLNGVAVGLQDEIPDDCSGSSDSGYPYIEPEEAGGQIGMGNVATDPYHNRPPVFDNHRSKRIHFSQSRVVIDGRVFGQD